MTRKQVQDLYLIEDEIRMLKNQIKNLGDMFKPGSKTIEFSSNNSIKVILSGYRPLDKFIIRKLCQFTLKCLKIRLRAKVKELHKFNIEEDDGQRDTQ